MTSGWGVDATLAGGVPTSGTTDLDVRKVWGALYTPGIISGCVITKSSSQLKYTVAPGVAVIQTATGEVVMAPIAGGTVTTPTVTSNRTDIVYAQQAFPTIEGNSNIVLGVASTLPPRAVALGTYSISAGATNTNSVVETADINYVLPYGASLGLLYNYQYKYDGKLNDTLVRRGQGSFYVPSDRLVNVTVNACLSALRPNGTGAVGFDNTAYCEYGFLPNCDGDFVLWTSPGLHQSFQTLTFTKTITVSKGRHNVNLGMMKMVGPGDAFSHYGTDPQGYGRIGVEMIIIDAGPQK